MYTSLTMYNLTTYNELVNSTKALTVFTILKSLFKCNLAVNTISDITHSFQCLHKQTSNWCSVCWFQLIKAVTTSKLSPPLHKHLCQSIFNYIIIGVQSYQRNDFHTNINFQQISVPHLVMSMVIVQIP